MRDTVRTKKGYVMIDTRYMNYGWESVIFKSDGAGNIIDYGHLDVTRYKTMEEAREGHKELVERWINK